MKYRLNGIYPPVGTLLRGMEAMVVTAVDKRGVEVRHATQQDFYAANLRDPREIHSVYEHKLIPPRRSIFGAIKVMG